MRERQLVPDLVAVSSPISLSPDVALIDQLGENPMCGTFGDSYRIGDIAHPDTRVVGDTQKNVGVIGEEVPGRPCWRFPVFCIT